ETRRGERTPRPVAGGAAGRPRSPPGARGPGGAARPPGRGDRTGAGGPRPSPRVRRPAGTTDLLAVPDGPDGGSRRRVRPLPPAPRHAVVETSARRDRAAARGQRPGRALHR